jgi:hypothetical protein
MNLAEHAALGGNSLVLEDGREICDTEQPEGLDVAAPGGDSLNQARLTEEQAKKLRRRAKGLTSGSYG